MPLPFDTLTEIMSLLEQWDAAVMARTCKTLQQTSPRIMLHGPVFILCKNDLQSLNAFLSVDERRCQFLCLLFLDLEIDHDAASVELVISLLSKAKHLQSLSLSIPRCTLLYHHNVYYSFCIRWVDIIIHETYLCRVSPQTFHAIS